MGRVLLKYNGVVVIQSLPDNEPQTGRDLFDSIISRRCSLTGKASYFYNISTRQEFFNTLNEVCANVMHDELLPIIHFEMHGNPMGVVMKNGEGIPWKDFQDYCRIINVKMHNQLMISLAACCGCNIWEMIDIKQPAPYWGYIGPREEILVPTLIEDFTDFYDSLLSTENVDQALSRLTVNGTRNQYFFLSCKAIFERFIEQLFESKPIDKKATFHRLKNETKQNLPWLNRSQRRKQLKTSISNLNRAAFIAQLKKTFLMLTDQ